MRRPLPAWMTLTTVAPLAIVLALRHGGGPEWLAVALLTGLLAADRWPRRRARPPG